MMQILFQKHLIGCVAEGMMIPSMVNGHGIFFWRLSIVMGIPQARWMVYFMENPVKIDENRRYPYDLGNHHIFSEVEWFLLSLNHRKRASDALRWGTEDNKLAKTLLCDNGGAPSGRFHDWLKQLVQLECGESYMEGAPKWRYCRYI